MDRFSRRIDGNDDPPMDFNLDGDYFFLFGFNTDPRSERMNTHTLVCISTELDKALPWNLSQLGYHVLRCEVSKWLHGSYPSLSQVPLVCNCVLCDCSYLYSQALQVMGFPNMDLDLVKSPPFWECSIQ